MFVTFCYALQIFLQGSKLNMSLNIMTPSFQIVLSWFQFLVYLKGITCNIIVFLEGFSYSTTVLHLISIGFER